jgi:Phosphotransferase enzyme family
VKIADTPVALTPQWLSDALASTGVLDGTRVSEVRIAPVGTGQMCDSVRLTLTFDGPAPAPPTIIAKLPAADESSRQTALALRNYEIEVRFYQVLAPVLPIRTPRILYADIDVATARFVLLMEDLAPARAGDQLAGCTVEEATLALDELVKLHAPRWGDPGLAELEWLHRDPDASRGFLLELLPVWWSGFRERYAGRLGPEVHAAGDPLFARLEGFFPAPDQPLTVVHGDYRLDNLLFGGGEGTVPIAVVDWQTCAHGPALSDVAYFIGAGLLPDDRRRHEDALVRRYHERLLAAGVQGYGWDDCWTDYRRGTWAGLIMAIAASMLVERTARGDDMFMAMAHRHARHALDLDAPALL